MSELERMERGLKTKARASFLAAILLLPKFPNIAANRAYYCLFQAIVGELAGKGIRPQDIDSGAASAAKDHGEIHWTHSFVKANARMAGLDGREKEVLLRAYRVRIVADYTANDVDANDIASLLIQVKSILEGLGVDTGKSI